MRSRSLLLPTLLAVSFGTFLNTAQSAPLAAPAWNFTLAAAMPTAQDGIDLDQEAERIKVKRAKQQYLAGEFISKGDEAFAIADLEQALIEYSNAIAVMPSNQDARTRMAKVEAAMGNQYAGAAEVLKDFADRESVKQAQAMMAAEDAARTGDMALRKGDYDTAINQYRQAQQILGFFPLVAEGNLTGEVIKGKLASAESLREEARQQAAADRAARARRPPPPPPKPRRSACVTRSSGSTTKPTSPSAWRTTIAPWTSASRSWVSTRATRTP